MENDQSSIDDILGDLNEFNETNFEIEKSEVLLIGRTEVEQYFLPIFYAEAYNFHRVETLEMAANYLLTNNYALILVEKECIEDISSVSNLIRQSQKISRIILIYSSEDFDEVVDLFNDGSFDAVITFPSDQDTILKRILQQEAQYQIQKEVTNFVAEPPKMSKASFLLLDPSLNFGDPNVPLNFVGVMVVVNTVPKYNVFFEEKLNSDEILFAAFLSSITSLGDELFKSKESLKEINFGGISVIFRFYGDAQIAFLVEDLTKHNFQNAERRIEEMMGNLFPKYEKTIHKIGLSSEDKQELDQLFNEFNQMDELEEEAYEKQLIAEQQSKYGRQLIVFLTNENEEIEALISYLKNNEKLIELFYNIKVSNSIEETSQLINEQNVGLVVLDESVLDREKPGETGLFLSESIEELDPAVQIIYFSEDNVLDQFEIELLNSGNIDYIHKRKDHKFKIFASVQSALKKSLNIRESIELGSSSGTRDGLSVAKSMLKENLEAFDSEEKPALQGLVIAQNKITSIDPIFSKFYIIDGEVIDFDVEMMAGLVTSLKQISGEMFTQDGNDEPIDGLELAGHNLFVRFNSDFLFIYFVKNITPNTSILIAKELDAVTQLYSEIISESLGFLSANDLEPIFSKISLETHTNLTGLLEESTR